MKTLACIVGARPNFVKMAPILDALKRNAKRLGPVLVHTGQHYDQSMSDSFFQQLGMRSPDVHLNVGSGTQGEQTAKILSGYESWLLKCETRPDATLVVGDVNSTLACALASIKLGIPVIHVEAGLRSFDRTMPEEINRILTDAIADLLLVSEESGISNLVKEGRPDGAIKLVGNVMIDTLLKLLPAARQLQHQSHFGLNGDDFVLWTMHRPTNVDDIGALEKWSRVIERVAERIPIIFPVHPRTRARLESAGIWRRLSGRTNVHLSPPVGYMECLSLSCQAKIVITDSGGLQEESSVLGIPCLTLRDSTERPVTVTQGTSTLTGQDTVLVESLVEDILSGRYKVGNPIPNWDGRTAERIVDQTLRFLENR